MMELVQQDDDGPSPFRDMYGPGEYGIHHVATLVSSMDEAYRYYEAQGFEIALSAATKSGAEFGFIDAVRSMGHMIEIYEGSEGLRGFYQRVKDRAEGWDGSRPVRDMDELFSPVAE